MKNSSIFTDRRAKRSNPPSGKPCRRKGDFGEKTSDSTDWWLKVNYINRHLSTVKNTGAHQGD